MNRIQLILALILTVAAVGQSSPLLNTKLDAGGLIKSGLSVGGSDDNENSGNGGLLDLGVNLGKLVNVGVSVGDNKSSDDEKTDSGSLLDLGLGVGNVGLGVSVGGNNSDDDKNSGNGDLLNLGGDALGLISGGLSVGGGNSGDDAADDVTKKADDTTEVPAAVNGSTTS